MYVSVRIVAYDSTFSTIPIKQKPIDSAKSYNQKSYIQPVNN